MPLEIVTVPCLRDNYAYLIRDSETGRVGLVDAPERGPIAAALDERGWGLDLILITHHHDDHIAAVDQLRAAHGARVAGAAIDQHRLPRLDLALGDEEIVALGGSAARVMSVPGHTIGHIAFYFADAPALFSADSLMLLGCGRLFEGTPDQMWASLTSLAALPEETLVYSGHEYTEANARFAISLDEGNALLQARAERILAQRARNEPTVPGSLGDEIATNPFLRAAEPALKRSLGLEAASDVDTFAEIRRRKDVF
jgi:hydroxyacylglutathione hydrolase